MRTSRPMAESGYVFASAGLGGGGRGGGGRGGGGGGGGGHHHHGHHGGGFRRGGLPSAGYGYGWGGPWYGGDSVYLVDSPVCPPGYGWSEELGVCAQLAVAGLGAEDNRKTALVISSAAGGLLMGGILGALIDKAKPAEGAAIGGVLGAALLAGANWYMANQIMPEAQPGV